MILDQNYRYYYEHMTIYVNGTAPASLGPALQIRALELPHAWISSSSAQRDGPLCLDSRLLHRGQEIFPRPGARIIMRLTSYVSLASGLIAVFHCLLCLVLLIGQCLQTQALDILSSLTVKAKGYYQVLHHRQSRNAAFVTSYFYLSVNQSSFEKLYIYIYDNSIILLNYLN